MGAITVTARVTDSVGNSTAATAAANIGGVLLGHWRNQPSESALTWRQRYDAAEAQFGPFAGHWRDYFGPGSNGQLGADHRQALADGKKLFINWKPWSTNWAQVGSGARDSVITAAAQNWNSTDKEIWATIGHEPENDISSTNTAADFVAMFKRTADIIHAQAPLVKVVWTCMGWNFTPLPSLWPGPAYVDIMAHDPYITCDVAASQMADRIIVRSNWLRANLPGAANLPIILPEWGPDLGGNTALCPTGDRGTDQHRADAINGVKARISEIIQAGVIEMDYFDARTDFLTASGPDAVAYKQLKTALNS